MTLKLSYTLKWLQRSKNQFKSRSSKQKKILKLLSNIAYKSCSVAFTVRKLQLSCLLFSLVCLNYGLPVYKWEHFISFSGKAIIICGNSILLLILPIKKELPGLYKSDCSGACHTSCLQVLASFPCVPKHIYHMENFSGLCATHSLEATVTWIITICLKL